MFSTCDGVSPFFPAELSACYSTVYAKSEHVEFSTSYSRLKKKLALSVWLSSKVSAFRTKGRDSGPGDSLVGGIEATHSSSSFLGTKCLEENSQRKLELPRCTASSGPCRVNQAGDPAETSGRGD